MHFDPHVVDHANDVFHLLGIDDVAGKMVIHFGKSEITLHLALGNEFLELVLLLFWSHRRTRDCGIEAKNMELNIIENGIR